MKLHFNPQPKPTPRPKKTRHSIARKSKFHDQTNPFKKYREKRTPEAVKVYAETCRQIRLNDPTAAELAFQEHCRSSGIAVEREKIFTYANGQRFIIIDYVLTSESGRTYAIEVDGSAHLSQLSYDQGRDKYLASIGIRTIRFKNSEVMRHPETVLTKVKELLA